jgi:hypothetical protein
LKQRMHCSQLADHRGLPPSISMLPVGQEAAQRPQDPQASVALNSRHSLFTPSLKPERSSLEPSGPNLARLIGFA